MGLLLSLLLAQSVTPVQLRAGQDIARPVGATKLADGGYVLDVYVRGQAAGAGGLTDAELRASPVPVSFAVSSNTATGTLTASGQAVTLTTAGQSNGSGILITGTWTGTITFEASPDGSAWGTYETFNPITTVETTQTTTTTNGFFQPLNLAGIAQIRARASAAMTGTANVLIVGTASRTDMLTMAMKETGTTAPSYGVMAEGSDGTNARFLKTTTDGTLYTNSYVAFDGGLVTALQGTSPWVISGTVTANAGTNLNTSALALDATLTNRSQFTKLTDGTRDGTVKAASTAAIATDTALVVAVSPNNSVAVTGTVTTTPPSNASTNVTQFGSNNVATGVGASGVGVPRVTVANDSNILTTQSGTWTVQPGNTANTTPWLTTDTPRAVASANNTGTCTTVGVASVTVLASNASRRAYGIKASEANTVNVFCKLGATATTANMPFGKGSAWSQDTGAVYAGVIDCISGSAAQTVCVYEFN